MALAIVQKANGGWGDGSNFSWGSAPGTGNLLVVCAPHRSDGTTNTTATLSTTDGGYTKRAEFVVAPTDGTFRRGFAMWTKTATASETATLSVNWNGAAATVLFGLEISGLTESLSEVLEYDNGTTANATSISDNSAESYSGTIQVVGLIAIKMASSTPDAGSFSPSWTDLSASTPSLGGTNQMHVFGGAGDPSASGAYTVQGGFSAAGGTANNGLLGAALVFGTPAAGGSSIAAISMQYNRRRRAA